jgi:hypothetical protein
VIVKEFYSQVETTDMLIPPMKVGQHGYAFSKVHKDGTLSLLCVGIGDTPCIVQGDMGRVCHIEEETFRYGSGKVDLKNTKDGPSI